MTNLFLFIKGMLALVLLLLFSGSMVAAGLLPVFYVWRYVFV